MQVEILGRSGILEKLFPGYLNGWNLNFEKNSVTYLQAGALGYKPTTY